MSVRAGNDLRKRVVSDKIGLNQLNDQIKDIDIESETEDKVNSFLALAKKKAIKPIHIYIYIEDLFDIIWFVCGQLLLLSLFCALCRSVKRS